MTKRSFALVTSLMTHIWGPTTIRISGDESVAGQIRPTAGGGVECDFPERIVLIANHQVNIRLLGGIRKELTAVRSIPIGYICGGLHTRTVPAFTGTYTSSSRSRSSISPWSAGV